MSSFWLIRYKKVLSLSQEVGRPGWRKQSRALGLALRLAFSPWPGDSEDTEGWSRMTDVAQIRTWTAARHPAVWTHTLWLHLSQDTFIHAFVDGHFGCFRISSVATDTLIDLGMLISFRISVCDFELTPRNQIIGPEGSSSFNCLGNFHAVFHTGCADLHSNRQCTRVVFSP